jgi:predicted AAA+ superfamily ATPase
MIARTLEHVLKERFGRGKAIVVLGPRQVGKTTLVNHCLADHEVLFLNGDDINVRRTLETAGGAVLKALIGKFTWVFIDEAQRIRDIGLVSKLIVDGFNDVQLVISGSSALDINQALQEPLTGRKFEYHLYPIGWEEFEDHVGYLEAQAQLEERLIYGMYPDVIVNRSNAQEILKQLASSYLYQDVLALSGIRRPELLEKLLQALALQIGNEVSYNELAQLLEVDKATVAKYIDLLEKTFIVFKLRSFNRNARNEIKNNRKIYFYDTGIRNAILNNFNALDLRADKGALWENFLIVERMKRNAYHQRHVNSYFWRTTTGQEIDYVEEANGILTAYEFKWKTQPKHKMPASFFTNYKAKGELVDTSSFRDFVRIQGR